MLSGVLTTYSGTPPLSNCATVTPLAIEAAVVLAAPLVHPVNVVLVVPVYVIVSLAIIIVPALSNPDVLETVIVVTLSVCVVLVVVVFISSS